MTDSLTDNFKSRDASASKNHFQNPSQIFEQGPAGYKHFGQRRCSGKSRSFVSMRVARYKKIPRFTVNNSIFVDGDDLDDEKYFGS